jgi:hypothetical protein
MQRVLSSAPGRVASRAALIGLMMAAGCAPSAPPQAPEPPSDATPRAEAAPAAEPALPAPETDETAAVVSGDDGLDADIAELSASTRPSEAAAPGGPSPANPARPASGANGRDIVYRVTPQGLVIEIDGFHLRPVAKPFKDKSGAYGVELSLRAESFDGRAFWVNTPKEGPLSIAGKVEAKGGKVQRFLDEREGAGEEVVLSDAPRTFKQRWPGRGQPKLWAGQTLTLEVGLWGVRAESDRERPVRRLFTVKMVAGNRSPAVIAPPAMDWGS